MLEALHRTLLVDPFSLKNKGRKERIRASSLKWPGRFSAMLSFVN